MSGRTPNPPMNVETWTSVDNYTFNSLHPTSSLPSPTTLSAALQHSSESGLPDIAVSPSQGKFLYLQAKLLRARNVLEVGTLGGYSTIWLASGTPSTKVVSVEIDAHHAAVAKQNIATAGLDERVDIVLGAGIEVLPQLAAEVKGGKREKFDLVFIDADKENNWNYVDTALGMMESGGCVIVDNVVRNGKVADGNCEDQRILGARRVVEMMGSDSRVDGMVMQTVGSKGYDGFVFAVVV